MPPSLSLAVVRIDPDHGRAIYRVNPSNINLLIPVEVGYPDVASISSVEIQDARNPTPGPRPTGVGLSQQDAYLIKLLLMQ